MGRYVLPFPVLPGKTDDEAKRISNMFVERPREYWESRQKAGITLERAYLMKTPMGSFVIAYTEGSKDAASVIADYANSTLDFDRQFVALVKSIHGIDVTQMQAGPAPETIAEWQDQAVKTRQQGLAFVAPVREGMTEAGRTFAKKAYATRKQGFVASRRAFGASLEVVTLISTPMGDMISVYTEAEDSRKANVDFAASQTPYDRWFKDECKKFFAAGVDFDQPLPPIEEIFDSARVPTLLTYAEQEA